MNFHPSNRSVAPRLALRQGGFTLVELITVIVILGVLAAVALPRFADLGGSARAAKAAAIGGAIKSAAAMVKAQAMAEGLSCGTAIGPQVTLEGQTIDLNYCYPQASAGAILMAANVVPANDGLTWVSAGDAPAGSTLVLQVAGATTGANCQISYRSPTAANGTPTVTIDNSGC